MRLKNIYIQSIEAVLPVKTAERIMDINGSEVKGEYRTCETPDTKGILNPIQARRLSRLIKTNLYTSVKALQAAEIEKPDAVLTATGLGCLEDTERFLKDSIVNHEENLSPTSFIQSTHNTISSQVAIYLKCYGANYTYSQRFFSFENALLDAIMMMEDQSIHNALVNSADELTPEVADILHRINIANGKEATPGEGVVSCVLSSKKNRNNKAALLLHEYTYHLPHELNLEGWVKKQLSAAAIQLSEVGILITDLLNPTVASIFPSAQKLEYSNYSGQYFTSSSFAYWMAMQILTGQAWPSEYQFPEVILNKEKYIAILHQHNNMYYSLSLLSHVEA